MYIEDRLYLQMIIGTSIGIVLGILAFALVTTCTIGSLCKSVDAAESLPQIVREPRNGPSEYRLVPQAGRSDLEAIVVEWSPQVQSAIDHQVSSSFVLVNDALPTGHKLTDIPESLLLSLDDKTIEHLIELNANRKDFDSLDWSARDWMILTGGYNLLAAAETDAEIFRNAGYDIQIFFRNDAFRTAIVGYDSAEAATLDLVNIRADLRTSAQLGQLDSWCVDSVDRGQFTECARDE